MKKNLIQVLFERLSTLSKNPATTMQILKTSSNTESGLLLKDTIQALAQKENQSRGAVTAQETIPAEYNFEQSTPQQSQKIPARDDSTSEVSSVERAERVLFTARLLHSGFQSHDSYFIEQAKKLVSKREYSAKFVPFMSYRPIYSSLNAAQERWYFYWRMQVRQRQFEDTDLSYIYLHVYELINNIGVQNPEDGYLQLKVLWQQYRNRYPHLNGYLSEWLEDYAFVHGLTFDPNDVLLEFDASRDWYRFDESIEQYTSGSFSKMPLEMLSKLIGYDFLQSSFYQDGNQDIVKRFVGLVFDAVDRQMRGQSQKGIFETFSPPLAMPLERSVFSGAVYAGEAKLRLMARPRAYSEHQPLVEFLKGIGKYTENRLREATGYKTRLRNFKILDEHRLIVDRVIPVAKLEPQRKTKSKAIMPEPSFAPVKIELDLGRVQALHAESNEVRAMLLDGLEAEVHIQPITQITPPKVILPVGVGWQALSSLLSDARVLVLKAVLEGHDVLATLRQVAQIENTMPEMLLDGINEAALETVNDAILDVDGSEPRVFEDYRDDLQNLVDSRNP